MLQRRSSIWPPARADRTRRRRRHARRGNAGTHCGRPQVSLRALTAGHPVRKTAKSSLRDAGGRRRRGRHVHNLAPDTEERKVGAAVGAEADPVSGASMSTGIATKRGFEGYRRRDGRVGVRNHVLVLSPTGLTSAAARARRVARARHGLRDVRIRPRAGRRGREAALRHAGGPRDASERRRRRRPVGRPTTLRSRTSMRSSPPASRPSGCRCPACTRTRLRWSMPESAPPRDSSARRRRCAANACDFAELCVAVECGHSDATSGLVCNPLAGANDGARRGRAAVRRCSARRSNGPVPSTCSRVAPRTRRSAQQIVRAVSERERSVREVGRRYPRAEPGPAEQGRRAHDDRGEGARRHREGGPAADPRTCFAPRSGRPGRGSS